MAAATLSVLCTNPWSKIGSRNLEEKDTVPFTRSRGSVYFKVRENSRFSGRNRSRTRPNAGLTEIEPDLNEDPVDRWATPGIDPEDFEYGKYDGHHTYFEGEEDPRTFWELIAADFEAVGAPTGFQGLIAWTFLPAIAAGMYFNVPGEYLYIGAAIFATIYTIIELDKPDQPHNFEPQIYNMERGARDKLINDYNTMSIWEFNEKYGELWDFTIKRDDLTKL
uniref:Photosynthetic NDH subunit of subcomplex B 5, chloroplastic n=2 Tax=Rhizophora mucronata TaxID=61149 RepID=A0A2P2JH46_RHIMU